MIEFVTLLLGLMTGTHPVEVAATGEVAAVELRLDGESLGVRDAPPWIFEVDFGPDLLPHRVEALAYGKGGGLIAQVHQRVNYHRASVDAALVLERAEGERPSGGRVVWASFRGHSPRRFG